MFTASLPGPCQSRALSKERLPRPWRAPPCSATRNAASDHLLRPLLAQVARQYGVVAIGDLVGVEQQFFAGIDARRARISPIRALLRQLEEAFAALLAVSP